MKERMDGQAHGTDRALALIAAFGIEQCTSGYDRIHTIRLQQHAAVDNFACSIVPSITSQDSTQHDAAPYPGNRDV